jgi:hypothetical protein
MSTTIESGTHNNLPETQTGKSRSEEASARPEKAELEVGVIQLQSVLLDTDTDGIHIKYTWVQGGRTDRSYTRSYRRG